MPSKKEPAGSTANLPPPDVIAAAEDERETDIDAMFGIGSDDDGQSGAGEQESAAAGGEATTTSAAGAAGAEPVDGQASAPANQETPPAGEPVPGQTAGTTDGTSSPPPGQEPPKGGTPPAPGAAPVAPAPVDPNLLKVNSLEATVAALSAELQQLRASPPSGQPQSGQGLPPQPSGQQQDDLPRYALTLPPQVAAAINSGDDQQTIAGVTHMMNSLATIVHHNVRLEMRTALAQLMQTAQQQESERETATVVAQSRDDYYKAFPAHNNPLILPIIQAESMAMAGEFPGLKWDDNYRNALGQRVDARLAQLRQPAGNGGTPPPAPAAMLPSGARDGQAPGTELTGGELIMDTFS